MEFDEEMAVKKAKEQYEKYYLPEKGWPPWAIEYLGPDSVKLNPGENLWQFSLGWNGEEDLDDKSYPPSVVLDWGGLQQLRCLEEQMLKSEQFESVCFELDVLKGREEFYES